MGEPTPAEMLIALKDLLRLVEAVRFTIRLGRNQTERIDAAKALIARAEASP